MKRVKTVKNVKTVKKCLLYAEFSTHSVLWAGSVIQSQCVSVCVSVTKVAIVNYKPTVKVLFLFFFYKKKVDMVLGILNQEERQSCMIGLKVMTTFPTFFILFFILRVKMCMCMCMWHKTCDMWHLTCDVWLKTPGTWPVIFSSLIFLLLSKITKKG